MENPNALFATWPQLASALPHVPLGVWPTPVEAHCIGGTEVWVKREDLASPHYGGNKIRKLEWLLAGGPGAVLTFGPYGSHHVLATAIHAARLGIPCLAALVPQPMTPHHEAIRLAIHTRCQTVEELASSKVALLPALGRLSVRLAAAARHRLRIIPPGGTSPRGVLGFVAAGLELAEQVRSGQCPSPSRIYVALGTGGTAAGLALGLALAGLETRVVAVRVASKAVGNRPYLEWLAARAFCSLSALGIAGPRPRLHLAVDHSAIGLGYALSSPEVDDAVRLALAAGLDLETTYTGKALAALLRDVREGRSHGPLMLLHSAGAMPHDTTSGALDSCLFEMIEPHHPDQ